jgi:hypothetical protein
VAGGDGFDLGTDAGVPEQLAVRCAWCGRVRTTAEWADVEAASLQVGEQQVAPTMSHSICPDCFETLRPDTPYP